MHCVPVLVPSPDSRCTLPGNAASPHPTTFSLSRTDSSRRAGSCPARLENVPSHAGISGCRRCPCPCTLRFEHSKMRLDWQLHFHDCHLRGAQTGTRLDHRVHHYPGYVLWHCSSSIQPLNEPHSPRVPKRCRRVHRNRLRHGHHQFRRNRLGHNLHEQTNKL